MFQWYQCNFEQNQWPNLAKNVPYRMSVAQWDNFINCVPYDQNQNHGHRKKPCIVW